MTDETATEYRNTGTIQALLLSHLRNVPLYTLQCELCELFIVNVYIAWNRTVQVTAHQYSLLQYSLLQHSSVEQSKVLYVYSILKCSAYRIAQFEICIITVLNITQFYMCLVWCSTVQYAKKSIVHA